MGMEGDYRWDEQHNDVGKEEDMMGADKEIAHLKNLMEIVGHTGFCMADYDALKCHDCPTEFECMKLFIKERAEMVS